MVKLKNEIVIGVPVNVMKDGDIAIITDWTPKSYVGRVVQRYIDCLICLGEGYGSSWGSFFPHDKPDGLCVRILEPGTELVV